MRVTKTGKRDKRWMEGAGHGKVGRVLGVGEGGSDKPTAASPAIQYQ